MPTPGQKFPQPDTGSSTFAHFYMNRQDGWPSIEIRQRTSLFAALQTLRLRFRLVCEQVRHLRDVGCYAACLVVRQRLRVDARVQARVPVDVRQPPAARINDGISAGDFHDRPRSGKATRLRCCHGAGAIVHIPETYAGSLFQKCGIRSVWSVARSRDPKPVAGHRVACRARWPGRGDRPWYRKATAFLSGASNSPASALSRLAPPLMLALLCSVRIAARIARVCANSRTCRHLSTAVDPFGDPVGDQYTQAENFETMSTVIGGEGGFAQRQPVPCSITSSANANKTGGKVTPSAFAVLRLITNSNAVRCATGKSRGLLPSPQAVLSDASSGGLRNASILSATAALFRVSHSQMVRTRQPKPSSVRSFSASRSRLRSSFGTQ